MSQVKISIIGAGSAIFSLRLVGDLCRTAGLSDSFVTLMDIDQARLEAVYDLARRYARLLGSRLRFEKTTELRRAVEGADFVINTSMVGGHAEQSRMRSIGEAHGYYRGIDAQEFNMVSDYFTLTNTGQFDYFLEIARLIEDTAPDAYYMLASNPVLEGTNLISRTSTARIVGFCHGYRDVYDLFEVLGMEEQEVSWQAAGVGALAAAFAFEAAKLLFSLYLAELARPDIYYGFLAGLVAFSFWSYYAATILLLGAELAHAVEERRSRGALRRRARAVISGLRDGELQPQRRPPPSRGRPLE